MFSFFIQVKVYKDLTVVEAARVAYLHNEASHNGHGQTFKDKATMCRKLLYHINDVDISTEEPPATDLTWRHACALALGLKCSGNSKDIDIVSQSK